MPISAAEATRRINKCMDEAVFVDDNGNTYPHVCIVCDHLLKKDEDVRIYENKLKKCSRILRCDGHAAVMNESLKWSYEFQGQGKKPWMEGVLLSPRANFKKGRGKGGRPTFSCCVKCKESLDVGQMPLHAIANKNVFINVTQLFTKLDQKLQQLEQLVIRNNK